MVEPQRLGACGLISASGAVLIGIMGGNIVTRSLPTAGLLLAGFGTLIGAALLIAGIAIYRSDVTGSQASRIAGWNSLGIVVLGAAILLFYMYQTAVGSPPPNPVFSGAVVVGVSAVAHVLIGVNDVRRIRAKELAQEREKLSVLARLVRHNLRSEAQVLYAHAGRLERYASDDEELAEIAAAVQRTGETFSDTHEQIRILQTLIGEEPDRRAMDITAVVDECVAEIREEFPQATFETDLPESQSVLAGEYISAALTELLENAVVHAPDSTPRVTVSVTAGGDGAVVLTVSDNGSGVPEHEREVVLGETSITQLDHASGIGLWLVRWIVDAYDGEFDIDENEAGGADVSLRLPSA
ncbi:sensor histidine kinase [Halovenus marina]|uniref:sensor histidine kinase n=1 Tax=Halovenus marina TaxID=3396621 RepID=UPI003F57E730